MFKTTVTAWLVRLAITWVGAGVIAFLVADYVLRENVEAVGAPMGEVTSGIGRLEEAVAAQGAEIAALQAAVAEAGAEEAAAAEEEAPVEEEAPAEAGEGDEAAAEDAPEEAPEAEEAPAEAPEEETPSE